VYNNYQECIIFPNKSNKMSKTSGILKKTNYKEKNVELLCFGYSCKLFKDDLKALEFDRENHLIPAPYDSKELISR
jgi:hypothetical protein